MKTLVCACLLLLAAFADDKKLFEKKTDKERIYNVSKDDLWNATVKAVKETFIVKFLDEKNAIISFEADSTFKRTALDVSVVLTEVEPNQTRIKINTVKKRSQMFGASGKDVAEKIFKAIDKLLGT